MLLTSWIFTVCLEWEVQDRIVMCESNGGKPAPHRRTSDSEYSYAWRRRHMLAYPFSCVFAAVSLHPMATTANGKARCTDAPSETGATHAWQVAGAQKWRLGELHATQTAMRVERREQEPNGDVCYCSSVVQVATVAPLTSCYDLHVKR